LIINETKSLDPKYEVEICGSFRRGAESSGDIDVLLTHPNYTSKGSNKKKSNKIESLLKPIVEKLEKIEFIKDTIAFGDTKFMVILS
jgi:DNA polymerase beta